MTGNERIQRASVSERVKSLGVLMLAAFCLAGAFRGLSMATGLDALFAIPEIDSSFSYGAIFVAGALTGVHCLGMCGAINLTATLGCAEGRGGTGARFVSPFLYNAGRLVSYTAIGGLAGAFGAVFGLSKGVSAVLITAAGIAMIAMSLRTAGVISVRLPSLISSARLQNHAGKKQTPFVIGLANGLMPCGPLQAMQLYALGSGSCLSGALSMFLFCLGTIPLTMAFGCFSKLFDKKWKPIAMKVAAALMLVLAVGMVGRGLSFAGANPMVSGHAQAQEEFLAAEPVDGMQIARFELKAREYANIQLKNSVPACIIIDATPESLTGCNSKVLLEPWNIEADLKPGENRISFTPTETGLYTYTCGMHMISNRILVVE